jgi:DNA-binding MarR family transcriptional regulator
MSSAKVDSDERTTVEASDAAALVLRAVFTLARRMRHDRPDWAMPLSRLVVLATLQREGPMSATQLAERERLKPQSLSRIIAALEQEELIARRVDESDKRSFILEITPAGRRGLQRDMEARRLWFDQTMTRVLTEDERRRLVEAADLLMRVASFREEIADGATDIWSETAQHRT